MSFAVTFLLTSCFLSSMLVSTSIRLKSQRDLGKSDTLPHDYITVFWFETFEFQGI